MPMPTFPLAQLGQFRSELHACFPCRADALFELGDALLCAPAITSVAQLSLEPSHRRGWASAYDALANGRINIAGCATCWCACCHPPTRWCSRWM
jgi:hypothetical protein